MHQLTRELFIVLGMVALMVAAHMVGLMALVRLTQLHLKHMRTPWLALDRVLVPLLMVTGLFGLHGLEVGAYAALYEGLGVTRTWEGAFFLSAGSYSTAGWLSEPPRAWRLVAAFESLNGMLLIGWSTAFLFQTLHRILQTEENHPLPEGAIAPEIEPDPQPAADPAALATPSPRRKRSGRGAP